MQSRGEHAKVRLEPLFCIFCSACLLFFHCEASVQQCCRKHSEMCLINALNHIDTNSILHRLILKTAIFTFLLTNLFLFILCLSLQRLKVTFNFINV